MILTIKYTDDEKHELEADTTAFGSLEDGTGMFEAYNEDGEPVLQVPTRFIKYIRIEHDA